MRTGSVRARGRGIPMQDQALPPGRPSSSSVVSRLLILQRLAGNRAVASLQGLPARDGGEPASSHEAAPRGFPDHVTVQRCGSDSHAGCACAEEAGAYDRPVGELVTQRALSSDFVIRGKSPSAGEPGNQRSIFFDHASAVIDSDELRKIGPLATPTDRAIVLHGFASEEAGPDRNRPVVRSRIDAVAKALEREGHQGDRKPELHVTGSEGKIAYREERRVDVVEAGGATPVTPGCEPDPTCEGRYQSAVTKANTLVNEGRAALGTPLGTGPMRTAFLDTSNATEIAVRAGLTTIAQQIPLHARPTHHSCETPCSDPDCNSAKAANAGRGAGANARLLICAGLFTDAEAPPEEILVHEAAHGAAGLGAQDHAKSFDRKFHFLHASVMPDNADSYRLYVRLVHGGDRGTVADEAARAFEGGFSENERSEAEKALIWLEDKLFFTHFTLATVYRRIHLSRTDPASEEGRKIFDEAHSDLRRFMAPRFGTTAPPTRPTDRDQWIMAGLSDRYRQLQKKADARPRMVKAGKGAARWAPGPGDTVTVGAGFLAADIETRVRSLARAIVDADPNISAARKAAFADLVFDLTGTDFSATEGPAAGPSPPGPPAPSPFVGLTRGDGLVFGTWDKRPVVRAFQERLAAGGLALTPDGKFGPGTAQALHSFQQSSGLPSSDTVTAATAAALDSQSGAPALVPA